MTGDFKTRDQICQIGRRLYNKGFAAANDGNITVRIGPDSILCTPTGVSKGFMKPADIGACDLQGRQTDGSQKITSEIQLHLEVYKGLSDVKAVVHCHPPHATAFGVAGVEVPTCVMPEVESAIAMIPTAPYETPGTRAFAETIKPFLDRANTVILANHGAITWGHSLEQAYFRMEILDAYCRILMLANSIGKVNRLPIEKVNELIDLKPEWGFGVDPRRRLENCDLCANSEFGRGVAANESGNCTARRTEPASPDAEQFEQLVRLITDQVMEELNK